MNSSRDSRDGRDSSRDSSRDRYQASERVSCSRVVAVAVSSCYSVLLL